MKKQLALALLIAGSVSNASLAMIDASTGSTPVTAPVTAPASTPVTPAAPAPTNPTTGTTTTPEGTMFSKVTGYLSGKASAVVGQAKAHPYIATTATVSAVLVAAYKFSATFRRLIGMETQEDVQKRYSAFEI